VTIWNFYNKKILTTNIKVATIQSLSGTGALRVGADFMKRHLNLPNETKSTVWLPDPTWGNHIPIYKDAGFNVKHYKYYDPKTCGLNWDGFRNDIQVIAIRIR
jgi:aspartate aminotransferase